VPDPTAPESFPAGFRNWTTRRSSKLFRGFPDNWDISEWREGRTARVAAVVHVHYPDLLPELVTQLAHIPVPFDLIVTNSSGSDITIDQTVLPHATRVITLPVDNHGRDILPLVAVVNSGLLDNYELVVKAHTKKSQWRSDHAELGGSGDSWRETLLGELLGGPDNVKAILATFASDPSLGLLTAVGSVVGVEFWGGDKEIVRDLLTRLGLELDEDTLTFASGSMYWVRGFLLQGLRSFMLTPDDFEPELGQVDGTTAHALERTLGILTDEAGYVTRETSTIQAEEHIVSWERFTPDYEARPRATVIPFYLPQFHPFPENDVWWGKGFTEWSNVAAAKPLFIGHNQPLLPGDLGFYDLRTPGVLEAQARLADDAGIGAMMFYYYWFAGRRLMDFPIERFSQIDSPVGFSIMWANENWTRTWDGGETDILIGQDYDRVPAEQFIDDVLPLISHPRYLRIDNKPVVTVYRVAQIPEFAQVIVTWRERALEAGLDGLVILTADVGSSMEGIDGDPADFGIDGFLEFAPHNMPWNHQPLINRGVDQRFTGNLVSYAAMVTNGIERLRQPVPDNRYPGIMVNFDNTARRQFKPDLWYGSNPYTFRRWLNAAIGSVMDRDRERRIVFLNAWNEWAEGTVLEPTQRWGSTYLHAVKDALSR
jgi:lipopolysaccharide biosynthesis protein